MILRTVKVFLISFMLTSCVSVADINHSSRRIEAAWLLDYQRAEYPVRTRILEHSATDTYHQVKRALVDIGLPVLESDPIEGTVLAQGIAPAPLNQAEWLQVVKAENMRVQTLSNGWMYLQDDPSNYVITVKVKVRGSSRKSVIVLNYVLSAPRYEAMGFRMPKVAPPEAVLIGSTKFWDALGKRLEGVSGNSLRAPDPGEAI